MEEFFKLISNFGFPIVISGYLLVRIEKKMDDINQTISGKDGVLDKIEDVAGTINDCCKKKK